MKKYMVIMLISLGVLFGGIFGFKAFKSYMTRKVWVEAGVNRIESVSTMKAVATEWYPSLKGVASLRAILGVYVTTELAGMVQKIYFTPGAEVKEGVVLVQLNADAEIGQLQALQAQAMLAKITYDRDQAQYRVHAVSKQTVDSDEWNLKNLLGQVAQQAATVAKKTLRAPFTGRLGINLINPGQYLNVGDKVTSLQTLNPVYADFYLPQQALAQLELGQTVEVTSDTYPDLTFTGKITTIEPNVDTNTRNVEVEATIDNPDFKLAPGMFASVEVKTGKTVKYITLPQTAITFNPYGDIVYLVKEKGKDDKGKPILTAKQVFVTTGETRGDQIAVIKGVNEGDIVITSGQLKLKNGSKVSVNNDIQPPNSANPKVVEK